MLGYAQSPPAGQRGWPATAHQAQQSQDAADLATAEALWREALRSAEEELGPQHQQIAVLSSALAGVLHMQGRDRDAYVLALRSVELAEASHDTRLIASTLTRLGLVLSGCREFARAEPVLRRSLALFEESEGPDAFETAVARNNLAVLYSDTGRYALAEQQQKLAISGYEKYAPEDAAFSAALANMFTIFSEQGRAAKGEPYLRRALAIAEKRFPETAAMAHLQVCLGALEFSRRNYQAAAGILQTALSLQERKLGPNHPELGHTLVCYSAVLRHLHNRIEAREAEVRGKLILSRHRSVDGHGAAAKSLLTEP